MSECNVMINGKEYAPVTTLEGEQRMIICVDNRGLTFVGDVDLSGEDEFITVRNARCIIRWGTTQHIAELVDGPLTNTRLGDKADVIVSRNNITFAYAAGGGWNYE